MSYSDTVFSGQPAIYLAIERLPYIPARFRERQIARIVADLVPTLDLWSPKWCVAAGDTNLKHQQVATQEAWEAVVKILKDQAAGTGKKDVHNWGKYLHRVCSNKVSRYFKSSAATGLTGYVGQQRRNVRIPRLIRELQSELGRHPTAAEVVEHGNRDISRRYQNPAKSGVLLTAVDVMPYIS